MWWKKDLGLQPFRKSRILWESCKILWWLCLYSYIDTYLTLNLAFKLLLNIHTYEFNSLEGEEKKEESANLLKNGTRRLSCQVNGLS